MWCLGQETGMHGEEGKTDRGVRAQGSPRSARVGTLLSSSSCVHEPPFLFHLPRDAGGRDSQGEALTGLTSAQRSLPI